MLTLKKKEMLITLSASDVELVLEAIMTMVQVAHGDGNYQEFDAWRELYVKLKELSGT